jgi:hypothetical protein
MDPKHAIARKRPGNMGDANSTAIPGGEGGGGGAGAGHQRFGHLAVAFVVGLPFAATRRHLYLTSGPHPGRSNL